MRDRHIFAIGDNEFRANPKPNALHELLLKTTGKSKPKVCMIPTASGDAQDYIQAFHTTFRQLDCETTELSLFRGENPDFEDILLSQDLIYVSGGNTRNMLLLWKEWGLDLIIRKAYEQGTVMAGGSAGSLCWFQGGVTDSVPGRFSSMKCLGYLPASNCPHYNELTRRPYYLEAVKTGELAAGYAAENGVGLHFVNEKFREAISAHEGRSAFWLEKQNGEVKEARVPVRTLKISARTL